ncbi:MAG TPA: hypothetical protein VGF96_09970 [Terracidiphilus sp.]|jgi:hypothetical protein
MSRTSDFATIGSADTLRQRRAHFSGHGAAWRALVLAIFLAVPAGGGFSQQTPGMGGSQFPGTPHGIPQDSSSNSPFSDQYNNPTEAEKRLRMINTERQKSMVADTDKLLKLAKELNDEIAKANSGELSPAQLRKVAEIEKLAHNVRDKMVMSVRGPQFNGPQFNVDGPTPYFPSPVH